MKRSPTSRAAGAIALALATTACAGVDNEYVPAISDLDSLALVEELRIGSVDDPDVGFSQIGSVRVTPSGEMFVEERSEGNVRLYDADGRWVRTYGRAGDGPGEFRAIHAFGVFGDTVWVSDGSLMRMTLFDRSGAVLNTVTGRVDVPLTSTDPNQFPPRTIRVFPNALSPRGEILGLPAVVLTPNLVDSVVDLPHLLFGPDGTVLDTVKLVPTVVGFPARVVTFARPGGGRGTSYLRIDPPAADSGSWPPQGVADGDSVAIGWNVRGDPPTGVLTVASTRAGIRTYRTEVSYPPRRVDPEYLDSVANARARGLRLSPSDSAELAGTARSLLQMPPHFRPVVSVNVGPNGSVWARLDETDAEIDRWLVVGSDGRARGVAVLPAGAQVHRNDDERVWIVERDELGVPWLLRYRIGEAAGG